VKSAGLFSFREGNLGKYTEKLMKDFQEYLQTLTDDPITIADAEESLDNLVNLYLFLAETEKAHRPELEALRNVQNQSINAHEMQQNSSEKQVNSKEIPSEIPRKNQGNTKRKPR